MNDKFLTIIFPVDQLHLIGGFVTKKNIPLLITKIKVKMPNGVGNQYFELEIWKTGVRHLASFLRLSNEDLVRLIDNNEMDVIQEMLRNCDVETLKLDAHKYYSAYKKMDRWSVHTIASTKHVAVPFNDIQDILYEYNSPYIRHNVNKEMSWTYQTDLYLLDGEKSLIELKVLSGRNIKTSAIKVMVNVQVGENKDSIRCATYQPIKHMLRWEQKLRHSLESAKKHIQIIKDTYRSAVVRPMTLDAAMQWIDQNIHLQIRTPEKVERIKSLLKERLEYAFSEKQNRFALGRTLAYVASRGEDKSFTEYSREQLQGYAHSAITEG